MPEDARIARQPLPLKTFYKTFGNKGELKELSESTIHMKIMFPNIVEIQYVKQLYKYFISIRHIQWNPPTVNHCWPMKEPPLKQSYDHQWSKRNFQ